MQYSFTNYSLYVFQELQAYEMEPINMDLVIENLEEIKKMPNNFPPKKYLVS